LKKGGIVNNYWPVVILLVVILVFVLLFGFGAIG